MDCESTGLIQHPIGLHARPAVKLAQLVVGFDADVWIRVDSAGEWVPARSTARVMKLNARTGQRIQIGATGPQAALAVQAVVALIDDNFDESVDPPLPRSTASATATTIATDDTTDDTTDDVRGTRVSPGIAEGISYRLDPRSTIPPVDDDATVTSRQDEEQRLRSALVAARDTLRQLASSNTVAREIIGFQISMLEDPDFATPAIETIRSGLTAQRAWSTLITQWAKDFEQLDDDYQRQRAIDLRDLGERVGQLLTRFPLHPEIPPSAVIVATELKPTQLLELPRPRAIVTQRGSPHDHTALLARALGIPMLIAVDIDTVTTGIPVVVDADRGRVVLRPLDAADDATTGRIRSFQRERNLHDAWRNEPSRTLDGHRIKVSINVDQLASLNQMEADTCDGIGLVRTEFLFENADQLRCEDLQLERYRQLLDWAAGRPVRIRTLDLSPDKPVAGLTPLPTSPLGLRGIRHSLAHPALFRVQLRALLRAAHSGPVELLLPMVTWPRELAATRQLLQQELASLQRDGIGAALPRLGIMLEVPAAALCIDQFRVDFFSIGSNDLTQYVLAADRDCVEFGRSQYDHPGGNRSADPTAHIHAPVLGLIERAARWGLDRNIEVSICGEVASAPECLADLLRVGIRSLTVSPAALGRVKKFLATNKMEP